jgi:four helix bundle protein
MRRAAVSIPGNISEGASRNTKKEFTQFLYVALGTASELETQLILAENLEYADVDSGLLVKVKNIKKMLNGLIRRLKESAR